MPPRSGGPPQEGLDGVVFSSGDRPFPFPFGWALPLELRPPHQSGRGHTSAGLSGPRILPPSSVYPPL